MVITFIYSPMLLAFPIFQLSFLIYFAFSSRLLIRFVYVWKRFIITVPATISILNFGPDVPTEASLHHNVISRFLVHPRPSTSH